MGFIQLSILEKKIRKKINKYNYLVEKYYSGETLEDRTKIESEDILAKSNGEFIKKLNGTDYCGSFTKKIDCKYQCDSSSIGLLACEKFYSKGVYYYDKLIPNVMNLNEDDISIALIYSKNREDFNEELLSELEFKAQEINKNTTFKQRIYTERIS